MQNNTLVKYFGTRWQTQKMAKKRHNTPPAERVVKVKVEVDTKISVTNTKGISAAILGNDSKGMNMTKESSRTE